MTQPLTYRCPAKVNLSLSVGPARAGDGYHPILSWMAQVSLFDDLRVERIAGESRFDVHWSHDAPQRNMIDWPIEKDLTFGAHRLIERHTGRSLPVSMHLSKRIPIGAGLAGGSSNGAMMLRAVNDLYELNLPDEALSSMGAELGSDVSFFLGEPSAIVSGVGEIVIAAPLPRPIHLALIMPPLQCETRSVYLAFDALKPDAALTGLTPGQVASWKSIEELDGLLRNDLTKAACAIEPRVKEVMAACRAATGRDVHLTGSGAAMFILGRDPADADAVAKRIEQLVSIPTWPVRTL